VARSLNLTDSQRQAIDRLYLTPLESRRHWIEHSIEAADRLDDLIRDGADNDAMLEQSHNAAVAAAEERALTRTVGEQIAAVLSAHQRKQLATLVSGQVVE
jgi:Spy/CpxP family protein refolding chaperone